MNEKNRNLVIIIVIVVIIVLLAIISILAINAVKQKNNTTTQSNVYDKDLYVSSKLPNISGTDNVSKDEFGKKTNVSENVASPKKWMNLDFTDFKVYSYNSSTSVISFKISNNTNMIIETGDFQLQLKNDEGKVVSIVNFEGLLVPCGGNVNVTVDVTGDITNVKDIAVDDINYTMELQEVK